MRGLPGYDRWLESGPGGPYDDGEVECPHCDGQGEVGHSTDLGSWRCTYCAGTGRVLASDLHEERDAEQAEDEAADAKAWGDER